MGKRKTFKKKKRPTKESRQTGPMLNQRRERVFKYDLKVILDRGEVDPDQLIEEPIENIWPLLHARPRGIGVEQYEYRRDEGD